MKNQIFGVDWKTSWLSLHEIQRIILKAHLQGTLLVLIAFFSTSLNTLAQFRLFVMFMLLAMIGYPALMAYFWIKKETAHEKHIN